MDDLPKELHFVIISFLDGNSVRALRATSTQWLIASDTTDFVFNFTTEKQLPQILERLQMYNRPISVTFQHPKCIMPAHLVDELRQLTNLKKLNVQMLYIDDLPLEDLMPLTSLTNLEEIDVPLPPEIMRHYTKLKKIYIESLEFAQEIDLTRFTRLEEVVISFSHYDRPPWSDPLLIVPNTRHITTLNIENASANVINEINLMKYSNLRHFRIADYMQGQKILNIPPLPNLEAIECRVVNIGSLAAVHRTLTSLVMVCEKFEADSLAALTKLTKLSLFWRNHRINCEELQFLTALTNLEWLSIRSQNSQELNCDWSPEIKFISARKLTTLEVYGGCTLDPAYKFCSSLKQLSLNNVIPSSNPQLQFFTNLTQLSVSVASEETLSQVQMLTQLKKLWLFLNNDVDLRPAGNLHFDKFKQLEELVFGDCYDHKAHIDCESIRHLPLKKLTLHWIDPADLTKILTITTLEELWLENTSTLDDTSVLTMTSLCKLKSLTMKRVPSNLTCENFTLLTSLQVLKIFSIGELHSSFAYVNSFKSRMPWLHNLHIN